MGDSGIMNCYEVLGLMRGASVEDIKAAFRLRSHMFHPDKYENYAEPLRTQLMAEAGKEFKKLTAAYEILRDPARRTAHDRELSA
ncbi:MAG: J domain-containing protein, partial [Proteobacteria bacterium]|nr:J domain-containing protein [Pseudomonadota bacterium]